MFRKFPFVFLAFILFACTGKPAPMPTPSSDPIDVEQQAVYTALLNKLYSSSSFVIMDTTATSPGGVGDTASILDRIMQNMHALDPQTAERFRLRNLAAHPVSPQMDLGSAYVLLTREDMNKIFSQNQDGWQIFYEQFPGTPGITTLSQVGFNDTFDQALVYVGTLSHWLAGAGYYVLLDKVNGAWVVDQQVMSWIS